MRGFLIALVAGCGAVPATGPARAPEPRAVTKPAPPSREPVDVIATLAQPMVESSWIVAGPAQLTLGGTNLEPLEGDQVLEVDVLEERGSEVRIGVRLPHARFAVWTARARLLAVLAREQHIAERPKHVHVPSTNRAEVMLRAGARVRRLARKDGWTQIRYIGALEVVGWVPDDALTERGEAGRVTARRPMGRTSRLVLAGTAIRRDPRWAAPLLAALHHSHFVEIVKPLDTGWHEVTYDDTDLHVHGFLSKRDPPVKIHRRREPQPTAAFGATSTVPAQTCLFSEGEPIGFTVAEAPVRIEPAGRPGWFTLQLDSPWGPLELEARGPVESLLETCTSSTP